MKNTKNIVPQAILDCTMKYDDLSSESSSYYPMMFHFAKENCDILDVNIPDLCISNDLLYDESGSMLAAYTFFKEDYDLSNNLIVLSAQLLFSDESNLAYAYAVMAHEMYHLHQRRYMTYKKSSIGYVESLTDKREIDADAYAIALTSLNTPYTTIDAAAKITCPVEAHINPEALILRKKLAEGFRNYINLKRILNIREHKQ